MKAFWWFEEGKLAGMARPGFNFVNWFDLPFDEAILMGWVGQFSSGTLPLEKFRAHIKTYAPKVFKFYGLDERSGFEVLRVFDTPEGVAEILGRLVERTKFLSGGSVRGERISFELCPDRLGLEIATLKEKGVKRIVALTEHHHQREHLAGHFNVHHIGIEDMGAPTIEQARELAELLRSTRAETGVTAVHCLAGIGRTSTMLIAAHLINGASFEEMSTRIKKRNPRFVLTGPQGDFIRALAKPPSS